MAGGKVTMTEGPLLGVLLRVAWPIAAANVAQAVHQLVNAFFVGRLGAEAIAAVAAAGPLYFVFISLASGLSTAGAVLVAQNTGAGNAAQANHAGAQTLVLVAAAGLVFALIGFVLAPWVLDSIGVENAVRAKTLEYLTVSYFGLIPMFCFLALQAMMQSVGEVRFAMRVSIAAVALNIVLDPLLIFGVAGWDGLGVRGAALATVTAQALGFVAVLHHVMSGHSALHFARRHFRPDAPLLKLALAIGIPASLEQGGRTIGSLLLMSLSALFGTIALAAYGVGSRVVFFWFTPMLGLSIATAAVVGQNIGAGKGERAEEAARVAAWASFAGFTILGLVHLPLLRPIMAALAPGETEVVRQAVIFGWAAFPFLGFMALVQALNGAFRGAGSTRHAMTIALLMQYGLQLPFAWGMGLLAGLGVLAVWWSYTFANVIAAGIAVVWLLKGSWRRNLVRKQAAVEAG